MTLTATAPTDLPQQDTAPRSRLAFDRTELRLLLTVLVALVAWGLSIFTWGVPGLYIPALAMVPVMYVILLVISRG